MRTLCCSRPSATTLHAMPRSPTRAHVRPALCHPAFARARPALVAGFCCVARADPEHPRSQSHCTRTAVCTNTPMGRDVNEAELAELGDDRRLSRTMGICSACAAFLRRQAAARLCVPVKCTNALR